MRIRNSVPVFLLVLTALGWTQSSAPPSTKVSRNNALTDFTSYSERTARTVPLAVDQLSQRAQTVVRGSITSAVVEPHPQFKNLLTVVVSMSVEQTLKGAPQKSFKFRQYIWDTRDRIGAAGYRKGEELLLLMGPVSQYGLTSPVGLEQGRFRILRDSKGNVTAVNGRGNSGLFQAVEQRSRTQGVQLSSKTTALVRRPQAGAVPLSDLEDAIRIFGRTK